MSAGDAGDRGFGVSDGAAGGCGGCCCRGGAAAEPCWPGGGDAGALLRAEEGVGVPAVGVGGMVLLPLLPLLLPPAAARLLPPPSLSALAREPCSVSLLG
jgi:hypothetical protein